MWNREFVSRIHTGHVRWRVLNKYRRVQMFVLGTSYMHYKLRCRVDLAIEDVGFDFAVAAKVARVVPGKRRECRHLEIVCVCVIERVSERARERER